MSWYFLRESSNKPNGPLEDPDLAKLIRGGKVKPDTFVRHDVHTGGEWVKAETSPLVSALFSAKPDYEESEEEEVSGLSGKRLLIAACSLAVVIILGLGLWGYSRYSTPRIDLHSADGFLASVERVKRNLGSKKAARIDFLLDKRSEVGGKGSIEEMIKTYREIGLSGKFHGMTAEEFLGELEAERYAIMQNDLEFYKDESLRRIKFDFELKRSSLERQLENARIAREARQRYELINAGIGSSSNDPPPGISEEEFQILKREIEEAMRQLEAQSGRAIQAEEERLKNLTAPPNFEAGPPK